MTSSKVIPADLVVAMREIIRYALMTLHALRDPDRKYLGMAKMPVEIVHDTQQAYGYSAARVRRFHPSPADIDQMERVLPWLAWLRREEREDDVRRIIAWAMGAPLWSLGQREGCSDRTILNRIDRSICRIIEKFTGTIIEIEKINEPYKGTAYAMIFEPTARTSNGEVRPAKIYISDKGFWRTRGDGKPGRWLDNRHGKFDLEKMGR